MKKILLSLGSLLFVSAVVAGTTGAFLQDSQTSTGNTFASGLVTMQYDNESYYTDNLGHLAVSASTTWALSNLAGKLFFNFPDIKPGDIGEDTISLHANNNNAWLCMNIKQTATSTTATTTNAALTSNLLFVFWADDGDNVYEQGEKIFKQGAAQDLFNGQEWALADSHGNVWGTPGPVLGGSTLYIGKAWCFGTMTQAPLAQDGKGKTGTNGPLVRGTGFTCSGVNVGNASQGLQMSLDVTFDAEQARNNDSFTCGDPNGGGNPPPPVTKTLFTENFNDCSKDGNKDNDSHEYHDYSWSKSWSCRGTSGGGECSQNLSLNAGSKDHSQSASTPTFSTLGYHTISLSYDRMTSGGVATKLVVDYSADGGSSWNTLETVTGNSSNQTKTFSLSPNADNKPSVEVRFTLTGTSASNQAVIDNITVTGVTP